MMTTKVRQYQRTCLGLLFLLAGSGCGKTYSLNEQVEGSIKVDGKPLVGVVVDFVPQATEALPNSTGVTDEGGQFKLCCQNRSGAVIGKHKVVIHPGRPRSPFDPEPVKGPSATPVPPKSNPPVPSAYTVASSTPLETEVTADKHTGYDLVVTGSAFRRKP
jgi:hypothetical protein